MQHIPLLFVLVTIGTVSCATSTNELIIEAKECVDHSTNELGVIGATDEQRTACWAEANDRIAAVAKRELEMETEQANSCTNGYIKVCEVWSSNDKRCSCVSRDEVSRALGGRY